MKECPVQIAQYEWEFDILLDLYKRVKPKVVLEIGSWEGGTLFHWLKEADWGVTVISIDLFATVDFYESKRLWESWAKEGQILHCLWGNSTSPDILDSVKTISEKVDWLFIDGDHTFEGAKQDYNNYFPMLNEGGYCVFHDIIGEAGVMQLWNEIKSDNKRPTIDIVHSKHKLGIGVIQNVEY